MPPGVRVFAEPGARRVLPFGRFSFPQRPQRPLVDPEGVLIAQEPTRFQARGGLRGQVRRGAAATGRGVAAAGRGTVAAGQVAGRGAIAGGRFIDVKTRVRGDPGPKPKPLDQIGQWVVNQQTGAWEWIVDKQFLPRSFRTTRHPPRQQQPGVLGGLFGPPPTRKPVAKPRKKRRRAAAPAAQQFIFDPRTGGFNPAGSIQASPRRRPTTRRITRRRSLAF